MEQSENKVLKNEKARRWIRRIGVTGFLFFLVKGLVWLAVIFGVAKCWE